MDRGRAWNPDGQEVERLMGPSLHRSYPLIQHSLNIY